MPGRTRTALGVFQGDLQMGVEGRTGRNLGVVFLRVPKGWFWGVVFRGLVRVLKSVDFHLK